MVKLKKIYSRHFPFKGFTAMTFWPFVIVRADRKEKFTVITERHETIHAQQQLETLWILFFVIYGLEFVIKLPICEFDTDRAYRSISFEQEAYDMQMVVGYCSIRSHYAWLKYLFKII